MGALPSRIYWKGRDARQRAMPILVLDNGAEIPIGGVRNMLGRYGMRAESRACTTLGRVLEIVLRSGDFGVHIDTLTYALAKPDEPIELTRRIEIGRGHLADVRRGATRKNLKRARAFLAENVSANIKWLPLERDKRFPGNVFAVSLIGIERNDDAI